MVFCFIDVEMVELSNELYGGFFFAREILGLDRFHRRNERECDECMCRILHGAGYDCVMRGTV